jgi:four helix bundle protein
MRDYKKYGVWAKAHELTLHVYKEVLACFPKSEQFELHSQLKRATYSVPLNIVEDCGRNTDKDFAHFLDMALASSQEAEYCALLAFDLGYLNKEVYEKVTQMYGEVKAMLIRLIKTIRK